MARRALPRRDSDPHGRILSDSGSGHLAFNVTTPNPIIVAPALAAPPSDTKTASPAPSTATRTPGSDVAYTMGKYDVQLNNDCTTGTGTVSGWDERVNAGVLSIWNLNASATDPGLAGVNVDLAKGTVKAAIKPIEPLQKPTQYVRYELQLHATDAQQAIAVYSGVFRCEAEGASDVAPQTKVTTSVECAGAEGGKVTVTMTPPGGSTNPWGETYDVHVRRSNELTGTWKDWPKVTVPTNQPATMTFDKLAPGDYLVDVGTRADGLADPLFSNVSFQIVACQAQGTAATTAAATAATAAKPGLANTGVRS